ncbi:unnamed protein product [Oikopleura dioica]|uniref:Uncharacterized protein n=1 Tax=Oikopleura dioica TaxID=34765 RepID=E4WW08_OIKDI|nr:unnamed protein product [Oikopleura dioica]
MGGNLSSPLETQSNVGDFNNVGAFNLHQGSLSHGRPANATDSTAQTLHELGLENLHLRNKLDLLEMAFGGFALVAFLVCVGLTVGIVHATRRAHRHSRSDYSQSRGHREEETFRVTVDPRFMAEANLRQQTFKSNL